MNKILKVLLIVLVGLVIAGGLFVAGSVFGSFVSRRMGVDAPGANTQRVTNPGRDGNGRSPGNGSGNPGEVGPNGNGNDQMPGQRDGMRQMPQADGRQGGRMGNGGDRGPGRMGPDGMMQQGQNITPLTADEAKKAAQEYITSLGIDGLEVGEVLTFDTNAYVVVKETATGNGAFELMIDPFNKVAHPTMGLTSAWNLKYGGVLEANMPNHPMKGQGAGATATPAATVAPAATPANVSADMPISVEQAIKDAQAYLDTNYAGTTAATTALKFYGYYSIDFLKDGKVIGKLSVNGYNGQVVGHAWRGTVTNNP